MGGLKNFGFLNFLVKFVDNHAYLKIMILTHTIEYLFTEIMKDEVQLRGAN